VYHWDGSSGKEQSRVPFSTIDAIGRPLPPVGSNGPTIRQRAAERRFGEIEGLDRA